MTAVGDVRSGISLVKDTATAWAPSTNYSLGALVSPTAGATWWVYECTTAGTSGTTEPSWPTTVGATVTDGTVVWTCRARYLDIQPPSTEEWVIHNVYHEADVDFALTDGSNNLVFDADAGAGIYFRSAFHVTNSVWIRVRNRAGAPKLIGYDGVVTKVA